MTRRLVFVLTVIAAFFSGAASAGAVVVDPSVTSSTPVEYKASEAGNYVGVALVPETRSDLKGAEIPEVKTAGKCLDPVPADLIRPSMPETGLCWHEGPVMHGNETFVLVWDPLRRYFATTKEYVEQFLRNVADGSGTLTSPYAVTPQYTDSSGRAGNNSLYGGACDDFGLHGGSSCSFSSSNSLLPGHEYPSGGCNPSEGVNYFAPVEPVSQSSPEFHEGTNSLCLTDLQLQNEIKTMAEQMGIVGRTQPGYTPLVVLLTPTGVETCLSATHKLCSAASKSTVTAQFCSYHSRLNVNGAEVDYVVQPWTAMTACDEPEAPLIEPREEIVNPTQLETELGEQLVSPLSQSHIAAIVNPEMNGWYALDGSEINDDGCMPHANTLDKVEIAGEPYVLQREFNNGWLLVTDPYVYRCAPKVYFEPKFVVPSPINAGQVVAFDGSVSPSTLVVPAAGYAWDFGDKTNGTGPSVEHVYAQGGSYPVKLTLTDRGGYVESVTETINVIGPPINGGQPAITDVVSHISGTVTEGDSLEASTGSWNGYPAPFAYAYQWQRCNSAGESCMAIAGATGTTYSPGGSDVGDTIRVVVTASNTSGSGTAISPQTSVVAIRPVTPLAASATTLVSAPPAAPNVIAAVAGGATPQEFTLTALLIPESKKALLRHGVALKASANEAADGVATVFVSAGEARHAHIRFRKGESLVMVGRGTIKGVSSSSGTFRLRLSRSVMKRLRRLRRVTLTVDLLAIDKGGEKRIVKLVGRY